MKNLAIVIVALPPSMDDVYDAWRANSPGWFDELRQQGRVTCSKTGAELAELGIDVFSLCGLLAVEDDAAGHMTGLRSNLDEAVAKITSGELDLGDFNTGLSHLEDVHDDHLRHPDLLDRIMHRHRECACYAVNA